MQFDVVPRVRFLGSIGKKSMPPRSRTTALSREQMCYTHSVSFRSVPGSGEYIARFFLYIFFAMVPVMCRTPYIIIHPVGVDVLRRTVVLSRTAQQSFDRKSVNCCVASTTAAIRPLDASIIPTSARLLHVNTQLCVL